MGSLCGALGFWIVTERLAYPAESLSHGLLPGLVLAAIAGAPLLLGAAGGALAAAVVIAFASRDARIGPDAGTAVAVTGLVGLGALLALSPDSPQRLEELLFGDPLGVTDGDLLAAATLLLLGGTALAALHRPLAAIAFDPAGAAAAGLRTGLVRSALLAGRRGRRGGAGPRRAACAGGADRPAGGAARARSHAGADDARRSGGGHRRRRRRHGGLLPRPQRRGGLRRPGVVRRGGARRRAQAVAARRTSRRTATIAPPSPISTREMSWG